MIIDAHVHICAKKNKSFMKGDSSVECLLSGLKKAAIDRAVLLPVHPFVSNDFIGAICRKYGNKFYGFASPDFSLRAKCGKKLAEDVRRYGLKGVKIHPRLQGIKLSAGNVADVAKVASDLSIPVLIDCFPQFSRRYPFEEAIPERIGELADKSPKTKIIMAHAGGYKIWDAFFVARAYKNIYLDFSFSIPYFMGSSIETDMGFVLKRLGAARCIYGSDHPEVPVDVSLKIAKSFVRKIGLIKDDSDYFFGNTLLTVLPHTKE